MNKIKTFGAIATLMLAPSLVASAQANDIVGTWKTASGAIAKIAPCGSAFCTTLTSGKFSGRQIGKVKKKGAKYVGTITDPQDDKSYQGSAKINGNKLKMTGCAFKIFCKTQTWTRQ
jgi:uncharacterized protein (DUF2147 family)